MPSNTHVVDLFVLQEHGMPDAPVKGDDRDWNIGHAYSLQERRTLGKSWLLWLQ